jgi:AcrR family transcriptional regulator
MLGPVGNREKLLDGALACLYEKGYTRTTARDIASAAGVSLAAIGYHFGTTERLLSEAMFQAMQQWGDELERTLVHDSDRSLPPESRRLALWQRVITSVRANPALWRVQFELVVAVQHQPELGEHLTTAQTAAREGLAQLFEGIDPSAEPQRAERVGAYYQALLAGVVVQQLVDPAHALAAADLAMGGPPTATPSKPATRPRRSR